MSGTTRDATDAPDAIVRGEDVNVAFAMERGEAIVVNDVDITVQRGEILGLVGESGSGKSMLALSFLDAVEDPGVSRGEVTYVERDGTEQRILDLTEEELRQVRWEEIAFVFQGAMDSFNPTLSIEDHFLETIDAHDADSEEKMAHARELLEQVYLDPDRVLNSYPHELSGGMQQRVLIALSLILDPELLIMDEPTSALDLLMQQSILALLDDLKETYDLTVIVISHDIATISRLCDRLAVMYAFEVVEVGGVEELVTNSAHPYTRALMRAIPDLGMDIEDMEPIPGMSPDPVNVPDGCSYHPRCPLATEECETEDPPFYDVTETQRTKCFHWEDASDAIPLDVHED
ncbi:MAG: ABC transporter ATP-binding protein [Halobacteriaceae archaeon]